MKGVTQIMKKISSKRLYVLIMSRTHFKVNLQRQVWLNGWVFVYKLSGYGFESRSNHLNVRYRAYYQGVDNQTIIECTFPLKRVRDMIRS